MKTLLTLTCCVGLALFAGAAQHDDQDGNNQHKKKGNAQAQPQQQQVVTPQTGKKFKTGPGAGLHNQNFQQPNTVTNFQQTGKHGKKQGPVTGENQTNVSGNVSNNAANTKLNKSFNKQKFGQGNVAGSGNTKFQKQHFNLQTNNKQVVINKYKTVNYNANYHIAGAQNWHGAKYQAFVNYHPEWHDTWWWNWHHPHVVFIYGGWYYWDRSYWYPAWGYAPNSVYFYDGPIYASSPAEDPAQTVANVQAALQEQGYYSGEVDGVLGPQTRAALAEYQSAQGLEPTGAVDEPTLETLGMV
jgi:hypothetical protein